MEGTNSKPWDKKVAAMPITPIALYPPFHPIKVRSVKEDIDHINGCVSLPSLSNIFTLHLKIHLYIKKDTRTKETNSHEDSPGSGHG